LVALGYCHCLEYSINIAQTGRHYHVLFCVHGAAKMNTVFRTILEAGPPGIPILEVKNSLPRFVKKSPKFPFSTMLNYITHSTVAKAFLLEK